jgi:hypothetical protein
LKSISVCGGIRGTRIKIEKKEQDKNKNINYIVLRVTRIGKEENPVNCAINKK